MTCRIRKLNLGVGRKNKFAQKEEFGSGPLLVGERSSRFSKFTHRILQCMQFFRIAIGAHRYRES